MGDLASLLALSGGAKKLVQVEFTSSTVWTVPATVPMVFVTAVGGGGGGACIPVPSSSITYTASSSTGGAFIRRYPITVKGTLSITIGAGGGGSSVAAGGYGAAGGNTVIGDITVGGGSGGTTGYSYYGVPQPGPGTVFDTQGSVYDGFTNGYIYFDRGLYGSPVHPTSSAKITKTNGAVATISGGGSVYFTWNGSSYATSPPVNSGQGGAAGHQSYSLPGQNGNPGYVMIEYFA